MHCVEAHHHVTAGRAERKHFDGTDNVLRAQTRLTVANARLRQHSWTQIQADGHDLHGAR